MLGSNDTNAVPPPPPLPPILDVPDDVPWDPEKAEEDEWEVEHNTRKAQLRGEGAPPIMYEDGAPEPPREFMLRSGGILAQTTVRPEDSPVVAAYRRGLHLYVLSWRKEDAERTAKWKAAADDAKIAEAVAEIEEILTASERSDLLANPTFATAITRKLAQLRADVMASDPWTEPTPLVSASDLPAFPVDGMSPVLRDMATEVAESVQVPVDLAALMACASLAASLSGRVWVNVTPEWSEVVTLYALGLIGSGNRKSALMRLLTAPLYAAQVEMRALMAEPREEAEIALIVAEAQAKRAKAEAVKSNDPDDWLAFKRAERAARAARAAVPPEPVLIHPGRHAGGAGGPPATQRGAGHGDRR